MLMSHVKLAIKLQLDIASYQVRIIEYYCSANYSVIA